MQMNELRRMTYLDATGIDMYVPRLRLQHAPQPKLCELPVAKTSESRPAESLQTERASPARGPSSIAELLATTSERTESDNEFTAKDHVDHSDSGSAVEEKITGEIPVAEQSVAFSLGLWSTDSALQIVDSVDPQDALPTHQLLTNILIARNLMRTQLPARELLSWPVNPKAEQSGWTAAHAFISDFFDGRFQAKPAKAILVFGEAAAKVLMGEEFSFEERCWQTTSHSLFDIPVVVMPALKTLLYQPKEKQTLWRVLSTLSLD
jgi:hypothetical protein